MAGVEDKYTEFYATFGGQPLLVRTLVGAPRNQKIWIRLPDGGSVYRACLRVSKLMISLADTPTVSDTPRQGSKVSSDFTSGRFPS